MKKSIVIISVVILAVFLAAFFMEKPHIITLSPTEKAIEKKLAKEKTSIKNLHFDLVDPSEAPPEIKNLVMYGYSIMLHTHEELPENVGDLLSCTNCHFSGGISTGGTGGGLSLAGVAAKYPTYNRSRREVQDLSRRINDCFIFSMSGNPLPLESNAMLALVTYLHWISAKYPIYVKSPWLGSPPLKTEHQPNAENGQKLFATYCATCHGDNGQGGNLSKVHPGSSFPPLWGPKSFHAGAGMNNPKILSSFIFYNMPYEEPQLSVEDAVDIAAFIVKQPRSGK